MTLEFLKQWFDTLPQEKQQEYLDAVLRAEMRKPRASKKATK